MNKKYMDFVPAHKVEKPVKKAPTTSAKKEVDELEISEIFSVREEKPRAGVTISKNTVKAPDYKDKFVKTEIKKQPLGEDKDVATAKARKISKMPVFAKKPATKAPEKKETPTLEKKPEVKAPEKKEQETLKVPKTNFVNTEKVKKRPLSKNVYQKEVVTPKETPSGPVTIIEKPEKDSRIGLVITIIITIILGAAAGTVAFLLLPK